MMDEVPKPRRRLEESGREELLQQVRRLLAEADALSSRISAVNEIGVAMNRTLDLQTILKVVARHAKWLLDFEHCSVCLQKDNVWHVTPLFGPPEPEIEDYIETDNIGYSLRTGQPKLFKQGNESEFLANYQSQMIIPLSADDILLGTVNFATSEPDCYTHDDMRIGYMLSLQLSSAIRNANIFRELQRTQEELQLRVEELDAYSHTIAHDLKSPLTNIRLRADLFNMKYKHQVPPEALDFVESINSSGKVMHRMIDQLLWLAKLRHADAVSTQVNINRVVEAAFQRFTHQTESGGITIDIQPDMPDAYGYDQWIEEIFANLISNAIKYMGEDNANPSIKIYAETCGDCVRYHVKDSGIGIKPEDQTRLFEMFTRLHNVEADGLGLGLSIVKRLIKKLEGEIGIESVYGEGTCFWFTLPLYQEE